MTPHDARSCDGVGDPADRGSTCTAALHLRDAFALIPVARGLHLVGDEREGDADLDGAFEKLREAETDEEADHRSTRDDLGDVLAGDALEVELPAGLRVGLARSGRGH